MWRGASHRGKNYCSGDSNYLRKQKQGDEPGQHPVITTLSVLCLRTLESSLGNGLFTIQMDTLPLGLAEQIYDFVFVQGSRMAQMEASRALAPVLRDHVTTFDCAESCVGDSALIELGKGCGPGLLHLDLSSCQFVTDSGVLNLVSRCSALSSLSLSGCSEVSEQVLYHLPHRVQNLTTLELAGLQGITNSSLTYISFLPSLQRLCLAHCNISDLAIAALRSGVCHDSLQWLDLTGTAIVDTGVQYLGNMHSLQYMSLSSTHASLSAVSAIARDLKLSVALLGAPKTRARSNQILLKGSQWSQRHLSHIPKTVPLRSRQRDALLYSKHGTSRRGWAEGRGKTMRLNNNANSTRNNGGSDGRIKLGFRKGEECIGRDVQELMTRLVCGIDRLWPPVPSR